MTLSVGELTSQTEAPLSWTRSAEGDFARYELHRSLSANFTPSAQTLLQTFNGVAQTAHVDRELQDDIYYNYRIVVYDAAGHASVSNEVLVDLPPPPVSVTIEWE